MLSVGNSTDQIFWVYQQITVRKRKRWGGNLYTKKDLKDTIFFNKQRLNDDV